ncbi:glycoside hydrolase family 3 N-terminal domain-containing protein [Rhizobium sp. S96]|uniref:glycoside hydrolase family 3 protein n=1 Tax=Rhizobium sp. S96 TaxID=3055140 RepID=UPI0025AA5A0B|nr:glycoside hydrolase family 3 N-terminal domain-containing protein [Rhizobium sp. S96]MDM9620360.1 glycoside hydrolase family 3 N-terminal domain-containing protein [Rhizobium sp. S96]
MTFDDLANPPYNLDGQRIGWVKDALSRLSDDDRLSQLFNLVLFGNDPGEIERIKNFRPGSITRFGGADATTERALIAMLNEAVPVPLLVSADLEGSRLSLAGAAEMPNPLGLAALNDVEATQEVSSIMAQEARAAGINWSFTPVLDINAAFRSSIVATRGFGSDIDTIERHAIKQMEVFQRHGVASAVKHWPGEGFDDRDQHLLTTVNPLDLKRWEESFGRLYRRAIDSGVLSVMSAHIAFPAFIRSLVPDAGLEAYRPASISRLLNEDLLRKRLGFNGVIVSDATPMAGLGSWSKRSEHLPEIIASGCDVILFSDDWEADIGYLKAALADGRLTAARIEDALIRQLGLKAALGLDRPQSAPTIDKARNNAFGEALARRIPTLVKDVAETLPLNVGDHRRVLVFSGDIVIPFLREPLQFALPDMLRQEGFEVTVHTPDSDLDPRNFDLVLYLLGDETLLTRGRVFLDWLKLTGSFGNAMHRSWHEVPTVMISFGYPYLLYDAPRVPTYVNAYSTTETMQRAVVDALVGRVPWNRNNPVDPFCGLDDARF